MDERNMYFRAVFKHSDDTIPDIYKRIAENYFMDARNKAIEFLNPHYDEWNASYNKEINGEDDMEYYAYIQNKQNEILEDFNRKNKCRVKLYSDEYADIAGKYKVLHNKKYKECTVHLGLVPV